ncbi:MAG: hypothetical protein JSV65_00975 [Armatimonadota bacterium]|nr:MAG: hypothetical protein JSV65_00975 [Armatimonadota bacterium]
MRHRNMYYLTGMPGWMRFGFSPGWVGRSPTGMGPCASYLMTGQWPMPQAQWDAAQGGPGPMTREQELQWLRSQAEVLKSHLDQISSRVAELEKET